ncbi:uncharacterized protein FIESC28_03558 [Fusarium coffeatum]|uniref:Zn(2)-C6 fungal-type domain-containing protein n=1 Tax=Fusarium coffeatum TaxID=231269 RepID=A0A366S2S7_9HYPO|nr:uncharacterized protein FIESC28_03558 [Fusarium coffeatum]RBR23629.1 hypothetical protein FIESC28_03558 [Fusarium coffeatum]
MAQDDHGKSHGDSPNNPPASAPTSNSPSLAPIVASVTAPIAHAANAGSANTAPAPSDTTLPPITSIASAPFTASDRPTASTTAAATTSAPVPVENELPAVSSSSAPNPAPASAPAASPAPPAASKQNGDSRAPEAASATPASNSEMSNQHPGMPHGQPVSYPGSSTHYAPSVGVTTTQYGSYPAVTSQPTEPYRPSPMPIGSNMSLPSMRTIENPHGPSVSSPQGMPMSMPMAPVPGGVPYYPHQGMPMAPGYGLSDPMARYAIPHDPRLMGHRGPKKCDETHPTCNNCKKSKRECLGYDPIFRQQAGGQPSNIQPAPSQRTPPTVPSSVPSTVPSSIAPNPALTARPTNSYGSQPSMLPSSYSTAHATTASPNPSVTSLSYDSSFSNVASPPIKSEPAYEYSAAAIDPALHNPESSRAVEQRPLADNQNLRANKMNIDEIIKLLGQVPSPQSGPHSEEMLNEVTKVYHEMYAHGLSAFFETNWYFFTENGKMSLPRNPHVVDLLATFLKTLEAVRVNDHSQMAYSGILETRLVWELARLAYDAHPTIPPGAPSNENEVKEAQHRVRVVEALLCGDYLPTNPLCPPFQDTDTARTRQLDFWYSLAEFVRTRDNPTSQPAVKVREDMLARMRYLLDGRENRDVLYSIAVVRELAPQFDSPYGNNTPQHVDESDPKNRLAVASKFIYDESQVTGGTTNVVRRFCDIAHRAFVNPGVNIGRRN